MKRNLKNTAAKGLINLGIMVICLVSIFPYFWMALVSLKGPSLVYQPHVWIFEPTFENYITVFKTKDMGSYLINSAIVASCNCIISLAFGSMTAYALARFHFKGRAKFSYFLLFIRILPAVGSVIPAFVIAALLRVTDTHGLLIVVYMLFNVPFTVLMMRGFFEEISRDIEEAAMIDGCTVLQSLRKVVMPLAMPGLAATAIFCVINAWNEFVYAMLLTIYRASTVPTFVQMFKTVSGIVWGEMSAVGTISTLPVLIFAILVQKHMVRGLSFGAVKD
jgi:multiple sugar transport system permease protein